MPLKTVLITGASSGVGLHTALLLARQGYRVYATMRNPSKSGELETAAAAAGLHIPVLPLDVDDSASVATAVEHMIQAEGHIDVLICNAGRGLLRTLEQAEEDQIKDLFETNFFGVARSIKSVLPHMRSAGGGHIVGISSVGGLIGQPLNELYCASKFALEGLFEALGTYLPHYFNIDISLIEPGGIRTEFGASVMKHVEATGGFRNDAYQAVFEDYFERRKHRANIFQEPEDVAAVIADCLQHPSLRRRSSEWSEKFSELKTTPDPDGQELVRRVQKEVLGI